ncbi:MAG: hypothetical protein H7331_01155, partial [Bacteroidia bacterium]|nr:hypothetical protein [Bacteroidia bacterium]
MKTILHNFKLLSAKLNITSVGVNPNQNEENGKFYNYTLRWSNRAEVLANLFNSSKYCINIEPACARNSKMWLTTLLLIFSISYLTSISAQAQNNVGIGTTTPNSKAILELQANDKGLLLPRLTTMQMNSIATNGTTNGLLVYNTTANCFYYWNSTTSAWKSMCSTTGISNNGDTVVINLLKADSIFANYLAVNNAFIKNLFATYIKADSAYIKLLRSDTAYIKFLYSQYIKTDSIYANLGRFDSLVIKGLSIDSLIKQITSNYLNSKDTIVLKYLRADSIYTKLLRADSAFFNYVYSHSIKTDTLTAGFGKFDSLYVGGQNILSIISDSINANINNKAWLQVGNSPVIGAKLGTMNGQPLRIFAGGLERISVMNGTGNVGIGQTLPAQKLDILGNQTTTGFVEFYKELKPAGLTGVAGQYLTSAGLGVAPTWTTITLPATTVSNTLTGTNLTTTVNGVTGVPIDLSTIAPATTVSNTYNTNTGALSTTVNGITGTNITLPTANNITDSIKAQAWLLKGNAGTTAGTNFIGTTDNVDLIFKRNGLQSGLINQNLSTTSFGLVALNPANTGVSNSAFGSGALTNNTTGYFNTAIGT